MDTSYEVSLNKVIPKPVSEIAHATLVQYLSYSRTMKAQTTLWKCENLAPIYKLRIYVKTQTKTVDL